MIERYLVLFAFLNPCCHSALAAEQPTLPARIDEAIAPYYQADGPGAVVVVTRNGKTVFRKAYGRADVAKGMSLAPEMPLRVGSITKQFTATAIMMLADEGKLAVGDEMTKYLPEFPAKGKTITIEHLLTHTSGLANFTDKPDAGIGTKRAIGVGELIDSFKNDALLTDPGTRFHYSNSNYVLLGAIIEKVSGLSYGDFLARRIFAPLGMTATAYDDGNHGAGLPVLGYLRANGAYVPAPPMNAAQGYAASALVSSADDLARWDRAVSSGKLLKPASWQRAFAPYALANGEHLPFGYGWENGSLRGLRTIGHGGAVSGFTGYTLRVPQAHVYVAVLSNVQAGSGIVDPHVVARKAAAIVIGKPYAEHRVIRREPATLAQYAGVYKIDDKSRCTVRLHLDTLLIERTGRAATRLLAYANDVFLVENTLSTVRFQRDAAGQVKGLVLDDGDKQTVQERVAGVLPARTAIPLPLELLDRYVGRYRMDGGLEIEVSRDNDKFYGRAIGQPKVELFAMSANGFFANDADAELRFENEPDGPAMHVTLILGGQEMRGARF